MADVFKFRYIFAASIALFFLLLSATPLAEGSILLRVFEQGIQPVELENHPARGVALACNVTNKASSIYGLTGWKLQSTITYRVSTLSAPFSVRKNLGKIVGNSFGAWSPLTNGVSFTKGPDTLTSKARYDGQNIVAWRDLSRNLLGVTYVWYNPETKTLLDVDTLLNSRHPWSWTNPNSVVDVDQICPPTNAYDAQNILTHELGHWVGLDDLYGEGEEDLTMYGYGAKQELKKDTLESGDSLGTANIYP